MKLRGLALLLLCCAPAAGAEGRIVRFKTADGWTICGRYQPPRPGRPVALLVHGVAAGKDEWSPLEAALARRGLGTLAIDLRGHGASLSGPQGQTGFQGFDAAGEWPNARKDIEAAAAFLAKKGAPSVGYIGASIGANLASWADPKPRWLVLLSPGVDYRGVRLGRRKESPPTLLAAAPPDSYSLRTVETFSSQFPGMTFLKARQGHGAQMLSEPEFLKKLVDWIDRQSR